MDGIPIEKVNNTANLVLLITISTSLFSQVGFRSYLLRKMGNQTNELFSNKSVITMCLIYFVMIVTTPITSLYFQSIDLTSIPQILGMSLVLPIQILVCHDKAYNFFMARHPKIKGFIQDIQNNCKPENNELYFDDICEVCKNREDTDEILHRHFFTISEVVNRTNQLGTNQPPDTLSAWRLPRNLNNQPQVPQVSRLIHVRPALNDADE